MPPSRPRRFAPSWAGERHHQEQTATALTKVEVRLEVLPTLQAEIERPRAAIDSEGKTCVAAEQQSAVLAAKLDAATERATKAEAAATLATAQAHKSGEAMALEARKAETAQNTVANLTGKLDAMQAQITRQTHELDATRQEEKKANEEAAELRGKHAGDIELMFAKKLQSNADKSGKEGAELPSKPAGNVELKPAKKPPQSKGGEKLIAISGGCSSNAITTTSQLAFLIWLLYLWSVLFQFL
jgi:hypothetical protein